MQSKGHLDKNINQNIDMDYCINKAWGYIAPWWHLKNLIATNPLQGLEDLPFEEAIAQAAIYFENTKLPCEIEAINRATIKWCQIFFDEKQATISMPGRQQGVFNAWRKLALLDKTLHKNKHELTSFLRTLPADTNDIIEACLNKLSIKDGDALEMFTFLLTTLPGWAGYIKYQNEWTQNYITHPHSINQREYLALRLILCCLLWPDTNIRPIRQSNCENSNHENKQFAMQRNEISYRNEIIESLRTETNKKNLNLRELSPEAQLVFCIDVRSEPIRRAIEAEGNYETFGYAGFFGIPVIIHNQDSGESHSSCPVLLNPDQAINTKHHTGHTKRALTRLSAIYQSLKYTFTSPFILAEALGPLSGAVMTLRTLTPFFAKYITQLTNPSKRPDLDIEDIPIDKQCNYAESALRMIGLTYNFSSLVVLCGHGSSTVNNAYASALDCGACGGHDGAINAELLARMLNSITVRDHLREKNILIPNNTKFLAALHNTTTDTFEFLEDPTDTQNETLLKLIKVLDKAKKANNLMRTEKLTKDNHDNNHDETQKRSTDWAETRPEWGLARNAAFIIGSRNITKNINLDGRVFLHSYDWRQDKEGSILGAILTAPVIVAQWINCQYLFSTLDNIAYGSGSKITHNVVGKIGIMQGNASDLMSGLPLQSIMANDQQNYHEPLRLLVMIHAPKIMIHHVIAMHPILQKLFGNGWILLNCIDPTDKSTYELKRNLSWRKLEISQNNNIRIF